MGRPGEVALILALFGLLGMLHGIKAQYNDFEDYDEREYDFAEDEEEDAEPEPEPEEAAEEGEPPRAGPQNQEFTPMCNNENCWIRVDWEPPPRESWMSCILGYRVGFRKLDEMTWKNDEWTWINDEGTHIDTRSDKLFFFEEAEGTNHSLTIRNLDFDSSYQVIVEVFSPYGSTTRENWRGVATPPGSCIKSNIASEISI